MDFELFKQSIKTSGAKCTTDSIIKLEGVEKESVFISLREKSYTELKNISENILAEYANVIDPNAELEPSLLPYPKTVIDLLNLHYYSVYYPVLLEFTQKVKALYLQKFPLDEA